MSPRPDPAPAAAAAAGPRRRRLLRLGLAAAGAALAGPAAGCSGSGDPLSPGPPPPGTVVVGSANYVENVLLAEIYTQALRHAGTKVTRQYNIGSREILYGLVRSGALTVVPEYNGSLLAYLDERAAARDTTTRAVQARLGRVLPGHLGVLAPSPAEDKNTVAVTAATARRDHLSAVGDLRPYARRMVFGGPPEFRTRHAGIPGLASVYGLHFRAFRSLDTSGPLTVAALARGEVRAATLFSTAPEVARHHFVLLADPRRLFGAQNITPLVHRPGLAHRDVAALDAVSARLTTAAVRRMMGRVVLDKQDVDAVARAWLRTAGLA